MAPPIPDESYSRIRWAVPAEASLLWRHWADHYVVYNAGSGHTHVVDAIGALALKEIEAQPLTLPEVTNRLQSLLELESPGEFGERLRQMLLQFEELGLIEAAVP